MWKKLGLKSVKLKIENNNSFEIINIMITYLHQVRQSLPGYCCESDTSLHGGSIEISLQSL